MACILDVNGFPCGAQAQEPAQTPVHDSLDRSDVYWWHMGSMK